MKPNFNELIEKVKKLKGIKFKSNVSIFLICLGISILIWFLIKLSKVYPSTVDYPIIYTNIPKDKLMVKGDTILSFGLRAKGFNLLSIKDFSRHYPISVDLSNLKLKKYGTIYKSYLLTSHVYNSIDRQIDFTDKLISISPDTLSFIFEDIIHKKIPIKSKLSISFKKQYKLYDSIKFVPDSIIISGPLSAIDTINYIETERKELNLLDKNKSLSLSLIKYRGKSKVTYSSDKVNVFIPVEKYTEANIELPIIVLNDNKEITIKTFPDIVNVTYLVALKDFTRIDSNMFLATVDYTKAAELNTQKLKINISHYPPFVEITKINPEKVEFIILK